MQQEYTISKVISNLEYTFGWNWFKFFVLVTTLCVSQDSLTKNFHNFQSGI